MSARRVVVTGMGVVSPLGDTPEALHASLARGESGLRPIESFATRGLAAELAGEVRDFSPADYLGQGNLRPLDRTARLAAAAARLALTDGGRTPQEEDELGLVLGTMFGSVHTVCAFDRRVQSAGPSYASPLDFANTVINAAAGQVAIWHGLRGINTTIAGGPAAGLQALAHAAEAVRTGRATALLAGGADELCRESFYGFARHGLLAASNGTAPCSVPFEARRNGFALGEGAALLLLEDAESARRRGAPILAEIRGWASAFDPSRGGSPRQAADAVRRAIGLALDHAGTSPDEIDAVSAAASGSVAGDRHEARGLAAAFGAAAGRLPVTAVKSMLGESLGAAGALQTVALIEALRRRVLPGVRGLERCEEGWPLGGARAHRRDLDGANGLVDAIGLDGHACALVVARPEGEA